MPFFFLYLTIKLLWKNEPFWKGFAFITPFFYLCIQSPASIREYHVDSTFKTNRMGCELFAVVANINGAGFPIAYFMFKHFNNTINQQQLDEYTRQQDLDRRCRVPALLEFFGALQNRGINPLFMFCDKDAAEISAITTTWGANTVRLCLWHLKQAVDRQLAKKRGRLGQFYNAAEAVREFDFVDPHFLPSINNTGQAANQILCQQNKRKVITTMMGEHYCRHTSIPYGM